MEVNKNKMSYNNLLLALLNKTESIDLDHYQQELKLNLYMTLLSLSNYQKADIFKEKINNIIEEFLRKTNNLKVKIQLKRKEFEIDKLSDEIIQIHKNYSYIISKYNENNLDIETIISSKDTKKITLLIDSLTKNKMHQEELLEKYHNVLDRLYNMLPTSDYYLEDNIVYFENQESNEILQIPFDEFKIIFNYLLDIDSYSQLFIKPTTNKYHFQTISDIIKILLASSITKENLDKNIIPMLLTYLTKKDIPNKETISTDEFNIENIKITELYSLAAQEQNSHNQELKTAKWKNISIPNDYLYQKIKLITQKGTYYFKEDKFVLENIDKTTNDFKINIEVSKMYEFLKNNLNNLIEKTYIKAK